MVRYYYNPAYKGYLRELKNLATCGGKISGKLSLYAAVSTGVELSPEQLKHFKDPRYYDGSLKRLEKSVKQEKAEMLAAWTLFLKASDAAGIERTHGKDSADYPLYKRFYELLRALEVDCDLRSKVHEWVNIEFKRIENGLSTVTPNPELVADKNWKELKMLSVPVIMARYDKLLQKRKKA